MWQDCPLRQNDPIYLVWGLQLSDLYTALIIMVLFVMWGESVAGICTVPFILYGLRKLKKDRAAGDVSRLLHWLGIWRIDGALPPQEHIYRIN